MHYDGSFELTENDNGKVTGIFKGNFGEYFTEGVWTTPAGDKTLNFTLRNNYSVVKIDWDERKKEENDAIISISIPELVRSINHPLANEVNQKIEEHIPGGSINNYLELIDDFEPGFSLETSAGVYFNDFDILSLSITRFEYMGGAHPNSYTTALNFDMQTGKLLSLDDLFCENCIEKLYKRAMAIAEDIMDHDEWRIEDIPEYLPTNFHVTPQGIMFFFNRYDLGSYAAGLPPEILLTYEDLKDIIHNESVLHRIVSSFAL